MWPQNYDENLNNNPFLKEIINRHSDILKRASEESWIICVPRVDTIDSNDIKDDAILDHILIPDNNSTSSLFNTLSKKEVTIRNKQVITLSDSPVQSTQILFEETFYLDGSAKYSVLCLGRPLHTTKSTCNIHTPSCLETLHDCIEYLWAKNLGHALGKIQEHCQEFLHESQNFHSEDLQTQSDLIGNLYSKCLEVTIKDQNHPTTYISDNLKLAVETYMQSCLDNSLVRAINTATCFSDASLNKTIRNSSDLQLKDLNILNKFCDVIANARDELGKINSFNTILDKINCLKLTFSHLYGKPEGTCMTSDDILQILIFIILKTNVNNWIANLVYLSKFKLSSLNTSNEDSFLVTTLEAAIEFIKSDQFKKLKHTESCSSEIFQKIYENDLYDFQELLDYKVPKTVKGPMCHPLCNCEVCSFKSNSSLFYDISCVNDKGQTLLIYSALLGRLNFVEYLISLNCDVNCKDYSGRTAIHYACLRGYQDILLVLINSKGDANIADNDKNTPLHLSCNNGHENCVKALVYTSKSVDIDCRNKFGETPLHLAVKWNYVEIIRILLENKASIAIYNKKCGTLASNHYVASILNRFDGGFEIINEERKDPTPDKVTHKEHGVKPKTLEQMKKMDLLLKAIENNDLPLTCFYLGFSNGSNEYEFQSKCHPLCNCEKCADIEEQALAPQEKINVNASNVDGYTPLHFAAKYGRKQILRILLDSGALPNLKTYRTLQTPLHLACVYQKLQIVKELCGCGECEVDSRDYKGNTPLYYACLRNDARVVEVLLNNGACTDVRNYQGHSLIKEVQEKNLYSVSKFFNTADGLDCL